MSEAGGKKVLALKVESSLVNTIFLFLSDSAPSSDPTLQGKGRDTSPLGCLLFVGGPLLPNHRLLKGRKSVEEAREREARKVRGPGVTLFQKASSSYGVPEGAGVDPRRVVGEEGEAIKSQIWVRVERLQAEGGEGLANDEKGSGGFAHHHGVYVGESVPPREGAFRLQNEAAPEHLPLPRKKRGGKAERVAQNADGVVAAGVVPVENGKKDVVETLFLEGRGQEKFTLRCRGGKVEEGGCALPEAEVVDPSL